MQIDHRCESAEATTSLTRKSRATQHFENQCAHHRELTTKCWVGSSGWLGDFVVIGLFFAVLFAASSTVEVADVVITILWPKEGGRMLKPE